MTQQSIILSQLPISELALLIEQHSEKALRRIISELNYLSYSSTELITAEQLRERLSICKASERSYVKSGVLKPQHLGKRVFYRWDEVLSTLSSTSEDFLPSKLRGKKDAVTTQKSR